RWSIDAPDAPPTGVKKSSAPGQLVSSPGTNLPVTTAIRDALVAAHNNARRTVTPTATNMRLMTWDASLATLATSYAARCLFAHNKNRRNERYHPVGENIYISSGSPYNVAYGRNAVEAWDGERVYYNYQTKTCTPNKMCGHYTQVVWADTFKVGCGVASCPTVNVRGRVWNDATILICNYGPGGNYINSFPYESGRSCTNCHSSDTCNNKLCTNTGRDSLVVPAASWMSWTSWSACSTTCGYGGTRRRSRECNTFVSKDCGSPAKEFEFFCASTQCGSTTSTSTSGANWRSWTSWTACSATCGGGRRERTRSCSSGRLQDCTGYNQQLLDCNRRPCPSWNNWRGWGSCSVTCGGGRKVRTRACNTGSDADCSGSPQASQPCNTNACPTGWSTWSSWSRCSTTCGGGIRTRNRGCQALSSSQCPGPRRERGPCNTQSCSAASGWSSWSAWSACSHTCGPSTSSSTRSCPSSVTC
uniref:SCP domain-containing protein n=1 Tax=Ciona savignyi TaxID=51511 RepID=H2YEX9_CIOSA